MYHILHQIARLSGITYFVNKSMNIGLIPMIEDAFSVSSVLGYNDSPIPSSIIGIPRSS
jgi:hypothetical protein